MKHVKLLVILVPLLFAMGCSGKGNRTSLSMEGFSYSGPSGWKVIETFNGKGWTSPDGDAAMGYSINQIENGKAGDSFFDDAWTTLMENNGYTILSKRKTTIAGYDAYEINLIYEFVGKSKIKRYLFFRDNVYFEFSYSASEEKYPEHEDLFMQTLETLKLP